MEDCNVSSWQGLHELLKLRYETREGRGGIPRHEPKEQDFELNALGETLGVTKEHSFRIIFWQAKQNICIWVYMPKQDTKYLSARVGKIISKSPALHQKPADCVSKTCEIQSPKYILKNNHHPFEITNQCPIPIYERNLSSYNTYGSWICSVKWMWKPTKLASHSCFSLQ